MIVKWPAVVKPGTATDQVACSIDLFPTILQAVGGRKESDPTTDGVSQSAALRGEPAARRPVFWHYPHYANQGSKPGAAVRIGEFKLIEFYEDGRRELYDLKNDISESRNIAAEKPDLVKAFASDLNNWRRVVRAQMPTPNPDYVPNPQAKDGAITMHARTATIHGTQLRFEPLPHKNTLGFWTLKDDWAEFEFTVEKGGTFAVEVLQGCGKDSGGAEVELSFGDQSVTFTVKDTGGFQNFETREVGTVKLAKPGRYRVAVKAKTKPGVAVMDLRQIVLKPKK
jgi:hypothetical protein